MKRSFSTQQGFTLVELLIALAISLFLLAALVQIMASSSAAYRTSEGVSRIQEGGRYAMEIIGRQIRHAGYHSNNISQNLGANPLDWPLSQAASYAVDGTNDTGPNNTDTLNIRYYIPENCAANNCLPAPVPMTNPIPSGDWIRITFQVDANRVLRAQIFDSGGADRSGGSQPLLEGVTDMQALYGILLNNTDMRYERADQLDADEWPNVVSVRVTLRLDSIDRVTNITGDDITNGRLERPYSATFTVRNRIPGA